MLTQPVVERVPMTREEYYLRAEIRENCLVDWEEGFAIRMPPAHSRHGWFIVQLCNAADGHLRRSGGGCVFVDLFVDFPTRTYGADLAILFEEHLDRHRDGRIQGPPDVVVEVISPSSSERDRTVKFEEYWREGVPWYWIGDPDAATLEEYRHTPEGYLRTAAGNRSRPFRPEALPGLEVDLLDLLQQLSPPRPPPEP